MGQNYFIFIGYLKRGGGEGGRRRGGSREPPNTLWIRHWTDQYTKKLLRNSKLEGDVFVDVSKYTIHVLDRVNFSRAMVNHMGYEGDGYLEIVGMFTNLMDA